MVVLARALQLRIPALDLLLRLTPPEADPFRPGDPAATRRFVEIVREVQASDFTPERLAYLFRHESEPRRDPGPLPAQVEAVLASIRRGLADAFAETSHPAEVTGDTLRQKLAMLLDPALLDPAMEALDPRTPLTPANAAISSTVTWRGSSPTRPPRRRRLFGAPPIRHRRADPRHVRPADSGRRHRPPPHRLAPRPAPATPAPPPATPDDTASSPHAGRSPTAPPRHRAHPLEERWKANVISCSSTCCRSCARGSCAARSCRR